MNPVSSGRRFRLVHTLHLGFFAVRLLRRTLPEDPCPQLANLSIRLSPVPFPPGPDTQVINWPLPKRVGNWVGMSKGTWDRLERQDKQKFQAKMPHHCNCGCLCSQIHRNCTAAPFLLVPARILPLQTIPSAISAVLIRTQLQARFEIANSHGWVLIAYPGTSTPQSGTTLM